jgi:septal ring factor EnvC (AmiA/AmiB activator)
MSLGVSEVLSLGGLFVTVAVILVTYAKTQAMLRQAQSYAEERLKKHSEEIDQHDTDLLRTTIRSEKNERDIAEMKATLNVVRDLVMEIRTRVNDA